MLSKAPISRNILQAVGAVYVVCKLLAVVRSLWSYVRPSFGKTIRQLQIQYGEGSWAVVTGASDGIGRDVAIQLARCGFNVCIIARTKSKLDEVVKEIESYGRRGYAVAFDFSTTTQSDYSNLFKQNFEGGDSPISHPQDVAILVNNVGMSHVNWDHFETPPAEDDTKIIQVNCTSMVQMSKYFVSQWKSAGSGRKRAIINISSLSAVVRAVPFLTTYAATKAFNRVFSESLSFEVAEHAIHVLTVTPGFVSTNMTQGSATRRPRTDFGMVDAADMAMDTLTALAFGLSETGGHRNHTLVQRVLECLPLWYVGRSAYKSLKEKMDRRNAKKQTTDK